MHGHALDDLAQVTLGSLAGGRGFASTQSAPPRPPLAARGHTRDPPRGSLMGSDGGALGGGE
jgi:hypothetical protein